MPDDLAAIEGLLCAARLPVSGVADHLDRFEVAAQNGVLIGCAGVERCGEERLLRSVVVAPAHQGCGLGKLLCERVLQRARADGSDEVYLLTTSAQRFFSAMGFTEVARDEAPSSIQIADEFSSLCPDSATLMRQSLVSTPSDE